MLLSLAAADRRVLRRGLAILMIVIVAGITVVETQMNRLTQRQEFGQALNFRRDNDGYYRAYVFGTSAGVRAVYPVGTIASDGRALTVGLGEGSFTVPLVLSVKIDNIMYWLEVWHRQFVAEARETKEELTVIIGQLRPLFRKIDDAVRQ